MTDRASYGTLRRVEATGTGDLDRVMAASPLAAGLPDAARDAVLGRSAARTYARGEMLFREGEPAEAAYLVAAGNVKLSQAGADGHEVIVHYVGPGEACGAVAAFRTTTYPVTAQAAEPTRVMLWSRDVLRELFERYPPLAMNAMRMVSERMREMQERFRELATERVAQRIARALLRLVRQAGRRVEDGVLIDLPLSRQDLAEMTGTTLFTVSRTLSQWEAGGIVESARERVTIRAPHRLVAIAEDLPPNETSPDKS